MFSTQLTAVRITGRLAISLFGGPEITNFRIPIGTETDHIGGSFGASAAYGLQRGGVTLSYSHGTTGGSGIVAGATGDNLTANATRKITRQWSALGNFGYGRTHGFSGTGVSTPGFNSFYFGAGLDRPMGRNALLSFGYTGYLVHQSDVPLRRDLQFDLYATSDCGWFSMAHAAVCIA